MGIRRSVTVTLATATVFALGFGSTPALADKPMPVAAPPKRVKPALPTAAEISAAANQAAAAAASAAAAAGKAAAAAGTSAAAAGKAAAAAGTQAATAASAAASSAAKAAGSAAAAAGSAATTVAAPTAAGGTLTLDELKKRIAERDQTRDARRQVEQDRLRIRWGSTVDAPAARDELKSHATRVARLERIQELAQVDGKTSFATRASKALDRETARHEKAMAALSAANAVPAASASGGAK